MPDKPEKKRAEKKTPTLVVREQKVSRGGLKIRSHIKAGSPTYKPIQWDEEKR